MSTKILSMLCCLSLISTQSWAGAATPPLTRIGVAGAVRGRVQAQTLAPQAVGRVIQSGRPLYLHEQVVTGPDSSLQILLLDETTFTIGPNSSMVLDEFVYDPKSDAGKITAEITKGIFRFITGKIAQHRPSDMKIKSPVGFIGVRGTIFIARIQGAPGAQEVGLYLEGPGENDNTDSRFGALALGEGPGQVIIRRAGFGARWAQGRDPGKPFRAAPGEIAALLRELLPAQQNRNGAAHTASDVAGQSLARAKTDLRSTLQSEKLGFLLEDKKNKAAQDVLDSLSSLGGGLSTVIAGLPNGTATWGQVQSITSGQATYSYAGGGADYNCTGGCTGSGSIIISLPINFMTQTIGDGTINSKITLTGPISDATIVGSISYAALNPSAPASLTLTKIGPNFNNSGITLLNSGGFIARKMTFKLNYNNVVQQATGSATATRP